LKTNIFVSFFSLWKISPHIHDIFGTIGWLRHRCQDIGLARKKRSANVTFWNGNTRENVIATNPKIMFFSMFLSIASYTTLSCTYVYIYFFIVTDVFVWVSSEAFVGY
jgi:hypothetical protein